MSEEQGNDKFYSASASEKKTKRISRQFAPAYKLLKSSPL